MLYLFNTTIMPNEGDYKNRKVSTERAREIADEYYHQDRNLIVSAIGHQGSADAFNALQIAENVQVNRIPAAMQPNDEAIAMKVLGRLPEGQILSLEELEKVGYEFYHIVRTA